jgi:hypothetical protein
MKGPKDEMKSNKILEEQIVNILKIGMNVMIEIVPPHPQSTIKNNKNDLCLFTSK